MATTTETDQMMATKRLVKMSERCGDRGRAMVMYLGSSVTVTRGQTKMPILSPNRCTLDKKNSTKVPDLDKTLNFHNFGKKGQN